MFYTVLFGSAYSVDTDPDSKQCSDVFFGKLDVRNAKKKCFFL